MLGEYVAEGVGAVASAVVGEDPLDWRALLGVGADHGLGEGGAGSALLACVQLDLRQSRVVVDGDVGVLPAGALVAMHAVLQDALSDLPEATEFLDVQMNELADSAILIPIRGRPWLALSTRAAVPLEHPVDRRRRPAQRG